MSKSEIKTAFEITTEPESKKGYSLVIAKTLAKFLDGDLLCKSKEGQGSTFELKILLEDTASSSSTGQQKAVSNFVSD